MINGMHKMVVRMSRLRLVVMLQNLVDDGRKTLMNQTEFEEVDC